VLRFEIRRGPEDRLSEVNRHSLKKFSALLPDQSFQARLVSEKGFSLARVHIFMSPNAPKISLEGNVQCMKST